MATHDNQSTIDDLINPEEGEPQGDSGQAQQSASGPSASDILRQGRDQGRSPKGEGGSIADQNVPKDGSVAQPGGFNPPKPGVDAGGVPSTPLGSNAPAAQPTGTPDDPAAAPAEASQPPGAFDQSAVGAPLDQNGPVDGAANDLSQPEQNQGDDQRDRPDLDRFKENEPEGPEERAQSGEAGEPASGGPEGTGGAAGSTSEASGLAEAGGASGAAGGTAAGGSAAGGAAAGGSAAAGSAAAAEGAAAGAAAAEGTAAAVGTSWAWGPVLIGVVVILALALVIGLAIISIAASGKGQNKASPTDQKSDAPAGAINLSGKELRDAFLKQKNITFQNSGAKADIAAGDVKDNPLRAVLAAAKQPGMGTIAVSSAACRSHKPGSKHCPPGLALDIGSVGTDNPKKINKFLCDSALKEKNPYKIDELFGIVTPGCVLDGGKQTGSNPDPPNHVHVATD